jgi:3',5'-cyclic AMP phosphodiesterase CpdA
MNPPHAKVMPMRRRHVLALVPALTAATLLGVVGVRLAAGRSPAAGPPSAATPAETSGKATITPGEGTTPVGASGSNQLHVLAIADSGSGNRNQQAVADRMAEVHRRQPVNLVVMAGDNIYPDGNLDRVRETFSRPYRALLEAGVPFHAVLGNHDIRTANGNPQVSYPPFGMQGRYYHLRRGPVDFFMLDTNVTADWLRQGAWLQKALAASTAPWKVVVGHHPVYSAGHYGDDRAAIARLTPLFRRHGVQLYINGHEHNYERTRVIDGTTYLTVGGAGAWLRPVRPNARSAHAQSVYSFAELNAGPEALRIQAWDLNGRQIDQVVLRRTKG